VKHGGREKGKTPEEGAERHYPEVDLEDGDRLRIGDSVLEVTVEKPMYCCECGRELEGRAREDCAWVGGTYICPMCKQKLIAAANQPVKPRAPKKPEHIRCKKCRNDVSRELGAQRRGDYFCASCRAEPGEVIRLLLERAKARDKGLVAIHGYTIQGKLGQGGMGAVYLARHEKLGEQVALKVMLPRVAVSERARTQFLREVEISKVLKHRNVVQLRDSGCSEGTFFFTQEYCEGGSVDKLMARHGGRLPVGKATGIILEALEGLAYAHEVELPRGVPDQRKPETRGVVHRDLSPQNILLHGRDSTRIAKVADFGLAKAFELAGLSGGTRTGEIAGKPVFTPRQQVIQYKYARPDVDVWAAAACLYNMLTGRFPRDFRPGRDPWQTVLSTSAVPIRRRDPSVPARLGEVIDHALIDKPEISFKTAADLKRALAGAL
jgi:serine/threonine-protein kinase